jgi:hypothetical protein
VLCELVPGGIPGEITAGHAAQVLESAVPSGAVEMARCELAAEFPGDLRRIDSQMRGTKKRLETAVRASGTTTTEIFGVGPVIAAIVIGCVTDVSRFASRDHFAAYNGTVPTARPEIEQAVDEALKAAELEVVTLDWDGFAAGTSIFTTIFLSEVWDTDHSLAQAHPDGVGDDIRQMLSMADLFRPGLDDARGRLAAWRQSLLDLFGQVDLLALPTMPVFPPPLADLAPDSLVDVIIKITQYTGLFNAAGTPCTAEPIRAAGTPIPASLQLVGPPRGEELLLATARQVEAAG